MSQSKKLLYGISWNFIGMLIISIVGILSSIIFARVLHRDDYGTYILLMSILATLVTFTSIGFELTLNKFIPTYRVKKQYSKLNNLVNTLVRIKFVLVIAVAVILFFASDFIANNVFDKSELGFYIKFLAVMLVPFAFELIFKAVLASYYEQKFINIVNVFTRLSFLIIAVVLLVLGYGIYGILISNLVVTSVIVLVFYYRGVQVIAKDLKKPAKKKKVSSEINLSKVLNYSGYLYLFIAMQYLLAEQLDILMIGTWWSTSEVAFYGIGYRFVYFSVSFFAMALTGGITLTYLSELHAKKDKVGLKKTYTIFFEYNYFFMIPISVGGIILSKELIILLYGSEYSDAIIILSIFFISMLIMKLGMITSTFLSAMDNEKKLLYSRSIFGITNLILNLILIPTYGAFGAVIGTSCAGVAGVAFESYLVHNLVQPKYSFKFLSKILIASGAMGLIIWGIKGYILNILPSAIGTAILILIGMAVFFSISIILKPISQEVIEMIQDSKIPLRNLFIKLFYKK
jgi:O-antigen/teichoic acid export membrane protein